MPEWLSDLVKSSPVLGGCLAIGYILTKAGLLHVRFGKVKAVPIPKPSQSATDQTESGRRRAVQLLDIIQDQELEMPSRWEDHVDSRVVHKFANLTQEHIYPLIERNKARLDRLEPTVQELRQESKTTHDSIIRLESTLDGVKDTQGEIRQAVKDMRDEVMVALENRRSR